MRYILNILIKIKEYLNAKRLKLFLSRIPIINWFAIAGFEFYITYAGVSEGDYWNIYFDAIEILQIGVVGNCIILAFLITYKYCWYNKVPVIGLLLLNFVNLAFTSGDASDEVFHIYGLCITHFIIVVTSILTLALLFKKI